MQEKDSVLTEYLCAKTSSQGPKRCYFNAYNNPIKYKIPPFHRYGNKGFAKVSDLPKVTQLVGGDELRI